MSAIGIFSAVKMYVVETGEVIDFWAPLYPFVSSVTLDLNLGLMSTIIVELDIPYTEGMRIFSETPIFHRGNVLQVKLGYSMEGRATPWYSGLVLDPAVSISPNGVSATLKALGAGAIAQSRCFTGQHSGTLEDWVNEIASRFGWVLDIDDATDLSKEVQFTGNGDNFLQITRTYLKTAGYSFWLGNNEDGKATMFVRRRATVIGSAPAQKFVMFGQPDPVENVHPILSWNAPAGNSLFAKGVAGVKAVYMDETGALVNVEKKEADSEKQSLGEESAERGNSDETDPESGQMIDKVVADDEASLCMINIPDTADGETAVLERRDELFMGALGITATCSTIGVPEMLPDTIAEVVGCSSRFDGLYRVERVTHRVSAGGFDTTWVGIRNGLPANSGGKPSEVPVNDQAV